VPFVPFVANILYWGLPLLTFLDFGYGVLLVPGGTALILRGGMPICFRSVSGEGIPGVGVSPGFTPFLISSGPGMPGVGVVPFGNAAAPLAGIPGTPFTGSGLPESPGGIFAGSSFIMFALVETELGTEVVEFAAGDPHADKRAAATSDKATVLVIKKRKPLKYVFLKWLCRLGCCVPGGQRRRPNRHGQVSNKW